MKRNTADRREVCIWPTCSSTSIYIETKMCQRHAATVAAIVERDRRALQFDTNETKTSSDEPERRPVVTAGVIYYVQNAEHIKIGWTSNLAKRMRQFAPNSRLLATHPGTRKDETRLHRMFAAHRTHGKEWYAPVPSVLRHIEGVRAKHGEPEKVVMGARPVEIPMVRPKEFTAVKARNAWRNTGRNWGYETAKG